MKFFSFPNLAAGLLLSPLASVSFQASAQNPLEDYFRLESPAPAEPGSRHFHVGALVGFNLKAQFSMSGSFTFSGQTPGTTGTHAVDHSYDDGYVRVDATGNDLDSTSNWSFNNASQYDGTANRLYFHSANSYKTASSGSATADLQVGFDTAYGGHLFRAGPGLVGWEFGFGFIPIKVQDVVSGTASVTRTVHWYDTSNLGSAFFIDPQSGQTLSSYTGPQGTSQEPAARLSDLATEVPGGDSLNNVPITGTRTLDATLYNFRLGPTLHWELGRRFAVALSAGGAMGFITGDLEFNETLVLSGSSPNNRGSYSDSKLVYGGYVAGRLMFHAVNNGDFYIGAQYMPLGSTTFSGGGRDAKLDLSGGVYISAGINWPF